MSKFDPKNDDQIEAALAIARYLADPNVSSQEKKKMRASQANAALLKAIITVSDAMDAHEKAFKDFLVGELENSKHLIAFMIVCPETPATEHFARILNDHTNDTRTQHKELLNTFLQIRQKISRDLLPASKDFANIMRSDLEEQG